MKELLTLFLTFAKIGGFTFGGGYAMLPIMQREIADKHHWATNEELIDYYAIGQCTPGVIAVNVATFIGQKRKGFVGGVFATLGVIAPSLVIITLIAAFLKGFGKNEIVLHALSGVKAAVVALVAGAVIKIGKKSIVDVATGIIFIAVTLLSIFTPITPALYVVSAGALGIVIKLVKSRIATNGHAKPAEVTAVADDEKGKEEEKQ